MRKKQIYLIYLKRVMRLILSSLKVLSHLSSSNPIIIRTVVTVAFNDSTNLIDAFTDAPEDITSSIRTTFCPALTESLT